MPLRAFRQRWLSWLILWVVGLAALAPAVSRTLAAVEGGAGWVEICTSLGTQWVQMEPDAEALPGHDGDSPASLDIDRCPLCVLMGDRLAPVPSLPVFAAVSSPVSPPALRAQPGYLPRRLLAAAPRGPPTFA